MNLKIRTFSMALAAMSATSYMYALPSNNIEEKSCTKEVSLSRRGIRREEQEGRA